MKMLNLKKALWLVLSIGLSSCTEQKDDPILEGREIASLKFVHTTPKLVQDRRISSLISSQPGTIYSDEKINDDIKSVFDSGLVDDVSFAVEPDGDFVKIIASVSTRRGFGPVLFVGNTLFSPKKLWEQISRPLADRIEKARIVIYDLETDEPIVHSDERTADEVLPAVCAELENFYRSQGYKDASVRIGSMDSGIPGKDDFVFVIDENHGGK